jgi:hypothetical protein
VNGKKVVVVSWPDGSKVQIANTGPAYPLRVDFKGHLPVRMVYSEYNVPFNVTAPPNAIAAPSVASRTGRPRPPLPQPGPGAGRSRTRPRSLRSRGSFPGTVSSPRPGPTSARRKPICSATASPRPVRWISFSLCGRGRGIRVPGLGTHVWVQLTSRRNR